MDIGKLLAVQNLQVPNKVKLGLHRSGSFHPASQTKIGLPPAVRMLYWLLLSPQKQNSNKLAMKKGGGFLGVAGGN
jgi:hypothetical protein